MLGVFDRYRSGTFWFTARNAGHYTTNTIGHGRGGTARTYNRRVQSPLRYQLRHTPICLDVRARIELAWISFAD